MRILFCGGGTEGHITPALALAEEMKNGKWGDFIFVGREDGFENKKIHDKQYPFHPIPIQSIASVPFIRKWEYPFILSRAKKEARQILESFKPDAIIATGGYVSFPVIKAAHERNIPIFIHESNAIAGRATRILSKYAETIFLGMAGSEENFSFAKKCEFVGTPVREEFFLQSRQSARRQLGLGEEFMIFSFGGSLGAEKLNTFCLELMQEHSLKKGHIHIHITGKRYYEKLDEKYRCFKNSKGKCRAVSFIDNIAPYLCAADIVLCRAGAATISEVLATGGCPILIPSPNVQNNHQYHNAVSLKNLGCALLLEEESLTLAALIEKIEYLKGHRKQIEHIKRLTRQNAKKDCAKQILHRVQDIISNL